MVERFKNERSDSRDSINAHLPFRHCQLFTLKRVNSKSKTDLILLSNSPFLPFSNSTKKPNFSVPSLTLSKVANVDFSSGGGFNANVRFVDCLERMERIDKQSERIERVEGTVSSV